MRALAGVVCVATVIFLTGCATRQETSRPVAVFIGDSYTVGYATSRPEMRWTTRLSRAEGWTEVNLGRSGTGYTTAPVGEGCLWDACPTFAGMVQVAAHLDPSVIVVAGGINDWRTSPAREKAAIDTFFARMHDASPRARLIAVGPMYPPGSRYGLNSAQQNADVRAAAKGVGARFVDMLRPSNVLGSNQIAPDGLHPTDSGHAAISDRIVVSLGPGRQARD